MRKIGRFIVVLICSFIVFYLFFFTMSWLGSILFHSSIDLFLPAIFSCLVAICIACLEYRSQQNVDIKAKE